jgi:hypothetical protein
LVQLNASIFAGYNDWRIPTIGHDGSAAELETILDESECGVEGPCVDPVFNNNCPDDECCDCSPGSCTTSGNYWSSTTNTSFPSSAWEANFAHGNLYTDSKNTPHHVRAVRGGF